jgi:hypothetical protein
MKNVTCIGHQGDVVLFEIDEFPNGERIQDELTKNGQLALGELSGHHHAFTDLKSVDLFKIKDEKFAGLSFFETKKEATLQHGRILNFIGREADKDYHSTAKFDAGKKYMTGIVKETDWLTRTIRRVVD